MRFQYTIGTMRRQRSTDCHHAWPNSLKLFVLCVVLHKHKQSGMANRLIRAMTAHLTLTSHRSRRILESREGMNNLKTAKSFDCQDAL